MLGFVGIITGIFVILGVFLLVTCLRKYFLERKDLSREYGRGYGYIGYDTSPLSKKTEEEVISPNFPPPTKKVKEGVSKSGPIGVVEGNGIRMVSPRKGERRKACG